MKEIILTHWATYCYLAFLAIVVAASIWTGRSRILPRVKRVGPDQAPRERATTAFTANIDMRRERQGRPSVTRQVTRHLPV